MLVSNRVTGQSVTDKRIIQVRNAGAIIRDAPRDRSHQARLDREGPDDK